MKRRGIARFIPIIIVLVIIVIAVIALISLGHAIFGGLGSNSSTADPGQQALLNTSDEYSVSMTVRGPIVASENYSTYTETISPTSRSLTLYKGYQNTQAGNQTLSNTTDAYTQFVYALNKAEMMKGTAFTDAKDDTRGVCATGTLYDFSVSENNVPIKHLWTTTCSGSKGDLTASVPQLQNLFLAQMPHADDLIGNLSYGTGSSTSWSF